MREGDRKEMQNQHGTGRNGPRPIQVICLKSQSPLSRLNVQSCSVTCYIPANSHACGLKTSISRRLNVCGPISHALLKNVSCCRLAWHNFQKYVNSDPCKEQKPCVKWMTIPSSWSLIFEVKSTGSELAFTVYASFRRLLKTSDMFRRLHTSSEDFGLLRESSEVIVLSSKIPALLR